MRTNVLLAAPLIAAAGATTTSYGTTHVKEISGSVTITSTFTYSNPATSLLTQTNSNGVITGSPAASNPSAVTSQPVVATIPAGLPKGIDTVYINQSSTLSSFLVSVGKSTTVVVGEASASVTTGPHGGISGGSGSGHGSGHGSGGSGASASASASSGSGSSGSSSSSSDAAPSAMKVASAGVIGLCAIVAALL